MTRGGYSPEDFADDYVECWPDNWQAFTLYASISNQWRVGMGGAVALDYGVLFHRMDRLRLDDETYESLFADVKTLEAAVLAVQHKT